ncbi:hypothetical protein vseg_016297 [Gypsophila vaccaria]
MDRRVEQQHKKVIRTTMLVQDRILKQQVKELHRLYDVQRNLLGQLKRETGTDSQSSTDHQGQLLDRNTVLKEAVGDLTIPITLVDYFDVERQSPNDKNKGPGLYTTDLPSTSTTIGTSNPRINDGDGGDGMVDLALSIGFGDENSTKGT